VHVRIDSVPKGKANLDIMLDDAEPNDHWVWLTTKSGATIFDAHGLHRDSFKLGRCLAAAQQSRGLRWKRDRLWVAYLKGPRLETYLDWLLGPSHAKPVPPATSG
jgi:hypothetical protein